MANELELRYPYAGSAPTIYATIRNGAGQFWRTDSLVFEPLNTANYSHYAVALAEQDPPSGWFYGTFPAQIPAGKYAVVASIRAGSTPAATDLTAGTMDANWSGGVMLSDYDTFEEALAIYAKLGSTVTVTSPVATGGSFTIYRGYDYTVESGTPIGAISLTSDVTLTGATLSLWNPDAQAALPFGVDLLTEVGTAKTLQFEITKDNLATLSLGETPYQLRVELPNGAFPAPLIDSTFEVLA